MTAQQSTKRLVLIQNVDNKKRKEKHVDNWNVETWTWCEMKFISLHGDIIADNTYMIFVKWTLKQFLEVKERMIRNMGKPKVG